jgi:hypothetical protein
MKPDLKMSETDFKDMVISVAKRYGWLVHHDLPSMNRRGAWATHVQGDTGFPDLFMVHPFQGGLHGTGIEFPIAIGVEVIGCSGKDHWYGLVALGSVNVCGQTGAIAHGNHDLLVDNSYFVKLKEDGFFLRKSREKTSQKQEENEK